MNNYSDIPRPQEAEEQFRALFDAHFEDVWRFARRRCDSGQDADDVTAETFAVAWRRRDDVPAEEIRLWLFGVVRRVLANQRRAVQRQHRLRLRVAQTFVPEAPADEEWQHRDTWAAALRALPAADRELLIMQAWDGLAVGEMATILDCSPNAVSLRLHKARRRLAQALLEKDMAPLGHVAGGSLSTEGGQS
jgi:RNA polymerase sigma-70 factor, ECF subfamily